MVLETRGEISAFVSSFSRFSARRFRIHYRDEYGKLTERVVLPLKYFCARDGREFLKAWCDLRQGERTFRVDRIERIDVVDDTPRQSPVKEKPAVTPIQTVVSSHPISKPAHAKSKKHRYLLKAACAAVIVIAVRGYFKEKESGDYATPPKIHTIVAKARQTRVSYTAPAATAAASIKSSVAAVPAKSAYEIALEVRASRFAGITGLGDKELAARYAAADTDRNGRLSWPEIGAFQRALYLSYSYKTNQTALRPHEFFEAGGGDCEDWSLVTAGLLRFWDYEVYIGSIRSLDDRQIHAVCLIMSAEKPRYVYYFHFLEDGDFNGTQVKAGYYIPIDYDAVGGLSNAVGPGWKLKCMYIPERIYGAMM